MTMLFTTSTQAAQTASKVAALTWPSETELAAVCAELRRRPALVPYEQCHALREQLAEVVRAAGFVVQGGDCAELFCEVSPDLTARKAAQLEELGALLSPLSSAAPVVAIGRIAGQFAKSRTDATEQTTDGAVVPVYLGDAVNELEATGGSRTPQPKRLLRAYERSAEVIGHLADLPAANSVFTSHEALLMPYEEPLVRPGEEGRGYASSGHLLWIGDRTRQVAGPHVAFAACVANPIAVKLGPTASPEDVVSLVERLDPARQPGRLTFVARLGADRVTEHLPPLVKAAVDRGASPLWMCDPMHGNTVKRGRRKARVVDHIIEEVRGFVRAARRCGVHPAGVHLEMTPDRVLECVDHAGQLFVDCDPSRYRSGCDPRLNPEQARRVVAAFAEEVA
jgi:3-deoxy-7-phosphoheptulonate synthase